MTDFIKKLTKEEKEEKEKRAALLHKEREEKEKTEEKKIEYIKKKDKDISIYIKKVPKEDKKEDKKPEYFKKKKIFLHNKRTGESVKVALAGGGAVKGNRGMGAALRGGGRAFLKGGKV